MIRLKSLKEKMSIGEGRITGEIYSAKEFHAIVEHERKRSDRTNDKFTVLLLDVSEKVKLGAHKEIDSLIKLILERIRTTDEVGWFDKESLGILLLDTSVDGAQKVGNDLQNLALQHHQGFVFKICAYPSDYLAGAETHVTALPPTTAPWTQATVQGPIFLHPAKTAYVSGLEPHLGIAVPPWKRLFDFMAASIGLILLFPLLVMVGLFIKLVSPGPIFFRQQRVGYLGRHFTLLKFRTMKPNADRKKHEGYVTGLINTDIPMTKLNFASEMIPLGKFLRMAGLDELPQLINVLMGQMSLVGPRPCIPAEFEQYQQWHMRRFYTLPGITGLWQVMGKHRLTFKEMIRYDITYEKHRSFWLDLQIILRTFPTVLKLATDG